MSAISPEVAMNCPVSRVLLGTSSNSMGTGFVIWSSDIHLDLILHKLTTVRVVWAPIRYSFMGLAVARIQATARQAISIWRAGYSKELINKTDGETEARFRSLSRCRGLSRKGQQHPTNADDRWPTVQEGIGHVLEARMQCPLLIPTDLFHLTDDGDRTVW